MGLFDRFKKRPSPGDSSSNVPLEPTRVPVSTVVAETPGTGEFAIGGFSLGSGVGVASVMWVGSGDRLALRAVWNTFTDTGLWAVTLDNSHGPAAGWLPEILLPEADGLAAIAHFDAGAALAKRWDVSGPPEPHFDRFPGLAPQPPARSITDEQWLLNTSTGELGIVAVHRPADVPARIGWTGAANYDLGGPELSAVLRSWEDRFGAKIVGLGFDTLTLAVERPATTQQEALAIAAEHFALCPDLVWQGPGDLGTYADGLIGMPKWSFWWD